MFILFQICVFSDSLLRPYVQKQLIAPPQFYINCTPGGTISHVQAEFENAQLEIPSKIYFVVGTNNIKDTRYKVATGVKGLIEAAKKRFPFSVVSV